MTRNTEQPNAHGNWSYTAGDSYLNSVISLRARGLTDPCQCGRWAWPAGPRLPNSEPPSAPHRDWRTPALTAAGTSHCQGHGPYANSPPLFPIHRPDTQTDTNRQTDGHTHTDKYKHMIQNDRAKNLIIRRSAIHRSSVSFRAWVKTWNGLRDNACEISVTISNSSKTESCCQQGLSLASLQFYGQAEVITGEDAGF